MASRYVLGTCAFLSIVLLLLVASASGCTIVGDLMPNSLEITPAQQNLTVGQTVQLQWRVMSASGKEQTYGGGDFLFETSKAEVATVNEDGLVTGVSPGTADITTTLRLKPSLTDTTTITVR